MNEDTEELENVLHRWRPRDARDDLARRVALDLERPPQPPKPWWQALGFGNPFAACGWGLAVPACIVVATLSLSPPAVSTPVTKRIADGNPEPTNVWQNTSATNRRFATEDEGVVLDATQRPVRRTRYRSEDTVAWRNQQTGAVLEVSYPREDVVTTPITMR